MSHILLVALAVAWQGDGASLQKDSPAREKQADAARQDQPDGSAERSGLQFDGTGSYVSAPNIRFDDFDKLTIEAWVKDWSGRILCQGKQGDPENSIWISIGRPQQTCGWESEDGANYSRNLSAKMAKGWVHVALVYDGKNQRMFINGRLEHAVATPKPGPFGRERPLIIGAQQQWDDSKTKPTGLNAKGVMSLLRISSIARYEVEFMPNKIFKADGDTVLLFDFSEVHEDRLLDASKNKRHGTIHAAKWVTSKAESSKKP